MKASGFLILFFVSLFVASCNQSAKFDDNDLNFNVFVHDDLKAIGQLQNDRNTEGLLHYFTDNFPINRYYAVLAMASVQDTMALNELYLVLETDRSLKVRCAAAFSIGQIGDSLAENHLIRIAANEKSEKVIEKVFEAIGKSGTKQGLNFIVKEFNEKQDFNHQLACLIGLARFSLRGISSVESIDVVLKALSQKNQNPENLFYASICLSRLRNTDLSGHDSELIAAYEASADLYVKMNLASAFSKAKTEKSLNFLKNIFSEPGDYRLKVNAIRSLSAFEYDDVSQTVFNLLNDTMANVSIQASEFFLTKGIQKDAELYYRTAKGVKNQRARSNMLSVALNQSNKKDEIVSHIISEFQLSTNPYEKANLLRALGSDPGSFEFVVEQINLAEHKVICTAGIDAISEMRRSSGFENFRMMMKSKGKPDPAIEFAGFFKQAISSGDLALVGTAAEIIRDPKLDFRQQYKNSFFLNQALNNCRLPAEIEIYRELQKTISYINGNEYVEETVENKSKPDWESISKIPFGQKVLINTNKGEIVLELLVNEAPVSVSNFLQLASKGYFNNKNIHRVVPNFVIQDGCPRGDGWGGPEHTICSEFAMNLYIEGSMGMASSGKDTEGSQWFITHSPTPHLDGRYTNFGKVIKGMSVVHRLEVGDYIQSIVQGQ